MHVLNGMLFPPSPAVRIPFMLTNTYSNFWFSFVGKSNGYEAVVFLAVEPENFAV